MSLFRGSFSSALQQNHQFFSSSTLLKNIGLSSFCLDSCADIYNKQSSNIVSIYSSLPEKIESNLTILDHAGVTEGKYIKFNQETKMFEDIETSISLSEVYDLIKYHEDLESGGVETIDEEMNNKIRDINISLDKCVIFRGVIQDNDIVVQLFFQSKNRRSNERILASKNTIMLAAPPCTPFGKHYSIKSFDPNTSFGDDASQKISNIGTVQSVSNDNNTYAYPSKSWPTAQKHFYQNAVAAPIQLSYDSNTNTWKSGNSNCLARLIDDLPAAPVLKLEEIDVNNTDAKRWLDQNSDSYVGGFSVGSGVPLSLERGNPHLFGPNFSKDADGKKLLTIKVVNRSSRPFSKGSVVMLTEINGEWIVQGFDSAEAVTSTPLQVGEWTFTKLIANSDVYFKDDNFLKNGTPSNNISVAVYDNKVREIFYNNLLKVLSDAYAKVYDSNTITYMININKLNLPASQFVPSKNYILSSIFDQLPSNYGGFNVSNNIKILYNNNYSTLNQVDEITINPSFFWGPLFTNGYTNLSANPSPDSTTLYSKTFVNSNLLSNLSAQFNQSVNDNILKQIPAELTSKLFDTVYFFQNLDKLGTTQFKLSEATKIVKSPYYGSKSSNNSVQFTPISLEFVGSTYKTQEIGVVLPANSLFDVAKFYANTLSSTTNQEYNLFGSMILRSKQYGYFANDIQVLCNTSRMNPHKPYAAKGGLGAGFQPKLFSYNCTTGENVGSNVIGIVGAKNTITKRGGGKINFSVNQQFGSKLARSVSGASSATFSAFGGFPSITPGTSPGVRSFPTWGSREDAIHSFGTLTLHTRIFDSWPSEQTIFDARYFSILHFNPGELGSQTGSSSVDFKIPTDATGIKLPIGTNITSQSIIKNSTEWIVNTVRRGQLLSNGGFWYAKAVIGFNRQNCVIIDAGSKFNINDEVKIAKNAIIVVEQVDQEGGILSFKFKEIDTDTSKYIAAGDGILPSDFNYTDNNGEKVFRVSAISPVSGGKSAIIHFKSGGVYQHYLKDTGPVEHTGSIIRLTSSSNLGQGGGDGIISSTLDSSVDIATNSTGQYDCFFHFHSDAGLYSLDEVGGPVQYVILNIT